MRIQGSKVLDAQMRALGAVPEVLAFSDVYQALQTGVVDGTENPPSNMFTQRMHLVQKYLTVSEPRLPGLRGHREQEVLGWLAGRHARRAGAGDARSDGFRKNHRPARQRPRPGGDPQASGKTTVDVLTPRSRPNGGACLLPVQQQMAGRIGKDLIEAINRTTAATR